MMNLLIIILIFTAILYSTAQLDPQCNSVCQLGGHYTPARGYNCYVAASTVICTCPGGTRYVEGGRCRLCEPNNNVSPVCNTNDARFRTCLESDDFGTAYACFCEDSSGGYATTDYNCDRAGTVTTPATTTTTAASTAGPGAVCQNGGAYVNGVCQCPSGFSGPICGTQDTNALCERITCKNNGVCAIRNPNGPYEAVCLCRYGTWGEYCELNGTLCPCLPNFCANNGACVENVVGTTRHAYCKCQPGYNGARCENNYFKCERAGSFPDQTMFDQGKYFTCEPLPGGSFRIEQKSCAKGLRFNQNAQPPQCTY